MPMTDYLVEALDAYRSGCLPAEVMARSVLAVANELRTANLLAAAHLLGGDAGSRAGELAAERLGLDVA